MKKTLTCLIAAVFAVGIATSASAAPFGKGPRGTSIYRQAVTHEQIQKLKKGDRYATVCMDCKSITVKEVADEKEVEALCHDGGSIHCDGCKKKATIRRVGPPGKETIVGTKVTYLNAEGKECMFIVPIKD